MNLTFILAMVLHPRVQIKAQEEIDRVVGPSRLPRFEDRSSLPYVEAIYREVLRWNPSGPLGKLYSECKLESFVNWKGSLFGFYGIWCFCYLVVFRLI